MASTTYILIDQVFLGEQVSTQELESLLALELISYRQEGPSQYAVAEDHCEELRTMLRLARDLEVNPAGIEVIMHMRRRLEAMQQEIRHLKKLQELLERGR